MENLVNVNTVNNVQCWVIEDNFFFLPNVIPTLVKTMFNQHGN
jgi:hypothetical protein